MDYLKPSQTIALMNDPANLHLCFEVSDRIYALNAKNVLEVTSLPLINEPQRLPEYIVGILNYNDMFINVIDIRKIFALPKKKYELSNKIIIMKGEESLFAMIVDEVTDFFTAVPSRVQRVMSENANSIIRTFYKVEDNIINIIDAERLEGTVKKVHFEQNDTDYNSLFPNDEESVCIMNKRSTDIASPPQMHLDTGVYGKDQYIVFKIENHTYCIYSLFIKELISLKNYAVTRIPYTPDFMQGIINLKGNFYTVIDLKKFIGYKPNEEIETEQKDKKIMVIESSALKLGFVVDDILNIINIPEENIAIKNDKSLDSLYINAEAYINKEVYNILNVDKLINDERLYVDNGN